MASSQNQRYQERLAARQRGAGTHKIQNVGFSIQAPTGAVFPPPPPPPPQKQPTPKQPTPKQPTPKPATPARQAPARRTTRSASRDESGEHRIPETQLSQKPVTPLASSSQHRVVIVPQNSAPRLPASTATTRRAASRNFSTPVQPSAFYSSSPVPSSVIETPTHAPIPRSRAVNRSRSVAAVTPIARGKRVRQPSPDKFLTTPEVKGINAGWMKESKRRSEEVETGRESVSTGQDKSIHVEDEEADETQTEDEEVDATHMEEEEEEETQMEVEIAEGVEEMEEEEEEEIVAAITSPVNQSKRRKVVIQEMEPEQDTILEEYTEAEETILEEPEEEPEETILEEPEEEHEEEEEEETQAEIAPSPPQHKRQTESKSKKYAPPPIPIEVEEESEEGGAEEQESFDLPDEEQVQGSHSPTPTPPPPSIRKVPAKQKQGQKPRRRRQPDGESSAVRGAFPIIIHRMTKPSNFTFPANSSRSNSVHAIDVINQVFSEVMEKIYSKLDAGKSQKRKVIESFKEELGVRFLELTDALDSYITLNIRVRQAQKRKAELREELMRIKRERAKIGVLIDDVRRGHGIASVEAANKTGLSTTFENISIALERGKARVQPPPPSEYEDIEDTPMEGLEALLRKVADVVTGGGADGNGLLAKVVEFNRFLEKAEKTLREGLS